MSMHTESRDEGRRRPEDDALALLIRQAGRRADPPEDAYRQVLEAARGTWQEKLRRRRRTRLAYGIAAGLLLAVGAIGLVRFGSGPAVAPQVVAATGHGFGLVMIKNPAEDSWRTFGDGDTEVVEGTRIRTGDDSGLALRLAGGESLRLAAQTEVSLASADRIQLDRGTLYLDTGRKGRSDAEIVTPLGTISHIGTQFEATYTVNEMRLRVREGIVRLQRGDVVTRADAGTQLVVDYQGGVVESAISPYGADWEWVQALAPLPETDEQPLSAFLEWIARETGRTVHFANRDLRTRAHTTMLHGQTQRLMPMEALAVMLQTTDFQYTVTGESEILIEDRRF